MILTLKSAETCPNDLKLEKQLHPVEFYEILERVDNSIISELFLQVKKVFFIVLIPLSPFRVFLSSKSQNIEDVCRKFEKDIFQINIITRHKE